MGFWAFSANTGTALPINMPTNSEWRGDDELRAPLMRLCARYLNHAKNPRTGYAFDPVANFHLRNGAVMWRINWMADTSASGFGQSLGMMVNYRYYLDRLHQNTTAYLLDNKINASDKVSAHLI